MRTMSDWVDREGHGGCVAIETDDGGGGDEYDEGEDDG